MPNYDNTPTADYNRAAALALLIGTASGLLVMALHPTGRDVVHNASIGGSNGLVSFVHAMAIVGEALVLAGALAIVQRLRARLDLAVAGYVFFALGGVAVMIAAVASGFLAPAAVRGIAEVEAAERAGMMNDLHYAAMINQAFAKISVILTGVALLTWSAAILLTGAFTRRLAIFGVLLATLLMIGVGSGYLRLNIHGYGLVVLGTGLWQVLIAEAIWRPRD
jgi:hypothetical protein